VLAVAGSATPFATAVALYEKWGQTDPVTVTGAPGMVDKTPVLFVTNIRWAEELPISAMALADSSMNPVMQPAAPPAPPKAKATTAQKTSKKATATRAARSGSKK